MLIINNQNIWVIFSVSEGTKLLMLHHSMYSLYAIFAKFIDIHKYFSDNLVSS